MRSFVRWLVLHGLGRVVTRRWAAGGDPQSALIADPAVRANPYPTYERVRGRGALSVSPIGYVTADHAVVSAILRSEDFKVTSVADDAPPPLARVERLTRPATLHPLMPPSLLSIEPPEHTRYRTLVSSVFTARAVAALRKDVQAVADRLLDELADEGDHPVDIVARYCAQLPVAVIGEILGVAEADHARVLAFGEQAAPSLDFGLSYRQFRAVEAGLADFDAWLGAHLAQLRRNPGPDLMSQLIQATIDGEHLDDAGLRSTAGLVLAAGFETTVNLLGSGIRLLAEHPDQLAALRADPQLWPNAVDEVLRIEAPVQMTARVARRQIELAGRTLSAGAVVALLLAGANRDPMLFADPARFDVRRENASRHLSFSGGRHFCLARPSPASRARSGCAASSSGSPSCASSARARGAPPECSVAGPACRCGCPPAGPASSAEPA